MRVILHNPHSNFVIGRPVLDFLLRIFSYKKYSYILGYLVEEKKDFALYVDGHDTSLPHWLARFFPLRLEVFIWMLLNNVNPFKTKVIWDVNKIKDDDVFLSFSLRNLDRDYHGLDNIADKKFLKIFHITHFVQNTSLIAKNVNKLNIDFLLAENNLSKNSPFFKKHFSFYKKDVYYLPFVFQERFKNLKKFNRRKNKAIATGTLVNIKQTGDPKNFKDFYKFYKSYTLQPKREMIYKNKDELTQYIDSFIGELYEKKLKKSKKTNILTKFLNKFYNTFISTKREYFKFNIVEKYNEYRMFINGEEINDLPGIGMVEGMACGTTYIGKVDAMYKDLGMKAGVHYIGYNGTIDDLKNKISYYQQHEFELKQIAERGSKLVRERFNAKVVAQTFFNDLYNLASQFEKNHYTSRNVKFQCSFTE